MINTPLMKTLERLVSLHESTDEQIEALTSMLKKSVGTLGDVVEAIGLLADAQRELQGQVAELITNLERSPRMGFKTDEA